MAHKYHFVALVGLMLRFSLDSGPEKSKSPKKWTERLNLPAHPRHSLPLYLYCGHR